MSTQSIAAPGISLASAEWLSLQQVIQLTNWTPRYVRQLAAEQRIISRMGNRILGNGRPEREYLASSLPIERKPEQTNLFPQARVIELPASSSRALLVSDTDNAAAQERFEIIRPLLEYREAPQGHPSQRALVALLSQQHNVSERTIWGWLDRYDQGGKAALADKRRADAGGSRFFRRHEQAAWLAACRYLVEKQSARVAWESIREDRELLGIPEDELPTYETVRAWLSNIPEPFKVYAREGRKAYRDQMAPFLRRGYEDVAANQVWVSDHMIHDVEVQNDCFVNVPLGEPMRLRFTCLLDMRARYVVGFAWTTQESSTSIATALRIAIEQHGPAEHFYCDNGKDYRRVAKGALPGYLADSPYEAAQWWKRELEHLEEMGFVGRIGMRVTHCIPHHPQSKHVERFFRTMHERFDKRYHNHYTGGAPHRRPDSTTAAMALHRRVHQAGKTHLSTHPLASDFIQNALAWIDEYHHTVQPNSAGMEGLTPAQAFEQYRLPRKQFDRDHMAMLLEEHKRLTVDNSAVSMTRGGIKRRFIAYDQESSTRLHELNRREVLVAYDPNCLDMVAILDQGGHLITWAKSEDFIRFAPEDKETQARIGASMEERRGLEKGVRNKLEEISRKARSNGARDRVERLADKALPIAVGQVLSHRPAKPRPDDNAVAPMSAADIAANFMEALKNG